MDWSVGYRELPPPRDLREVLSCVWIRVMPSIATSAVLVLPDAGVDVIWRTDADPSVAGPDIEPMPVTIPPNTVLVGARFRPGAAGPALRAPMSELRNQRVALSDLRPDLAPLLPSDLAPSEAAARLVEVVRAAVVSGPPDRLVAHATDLLDDPRGSVARVSQEVGLSDRQLRRRFQDTLGYGPKTLQRVLRFRRLLLSIGAPRGDLARLAAQAGYADQAHLTRECQQFAGMTPTALVATMSDSFKPPAVDS